MYLLNTIPYTGSYLSEICVKRRWTKEAQKGLLFTNRRKDVAVYSATTHASMEASTGVDVVIRSTGCIRNRRRY